MKNTVACVFELLLTAAVLYGTTACVASPTPSKTVPQGVIVVPGIEEDPSKGESIYTNPKASPSAESTKGEASESTPSSPEPAPPEKTIPQTERELMMAVESCKLPRDSYFERGEATIVASQLSDGYAILIRKLVFGRGDDQITCYVADVFMEDIKDLIGCVFTDEEGKIAEGSPQQVTEQLNALFVVNTDFMKGRSWGLYVRGGQVFRQKKTKGIDVCCIKTDGTMQILDGDTLDPDALMAQGDVWHVLTFGPSLLNEDGTPRDKNSDFRINDNYQGWNDDKTYYGFLSPNPRTAMGQARDGHYIFAVVDGRDEGYSKGMTFPQLSHLMYEEGCEVAYNLDGGGSVFMYYDGKAVNSNTGGRNPSDYFVILKKEG